MKRNWIVVSIALLSISVISCQRIMMKLAGINVPKVESRASIHDFLVKSGVDTANTFALDSALFVDMQKAPYKPGWDAGFRPFQIRFYDSAGKPVMQWASCEGYLNELKTFDSVPPKNFNGLNLDLTLAEDLNRYYSLQGDPLNLVIQEGHDYYAVVLFARWYPHMSRKVFRQLQEYIDKHPEIDIQVYKVCVDFMDFWGVDPKVILY